MGEVDEAVTGLDEGRLGGGEDVGEDGAEVVALGNHLRGRKREKVSFEWSRKRRGRKEGDVRRRQTQPRIPPDP